MRVTAIVNQMDPYNRRIIPGAAEFARRQGWDLSIKNVTRAAELPLLIRDADGLLLGVHNFENDPVLTRTLIPAVCWSGSIMEVNWRRVLNDDIAIGRLAAEHLLARGFRHFIFFNNAPEIWAARRRDGFLGRLEGDGHTAQTLTLLDTKAGNGPLVESLRQLPKPFGAMMDHDPSALIFMAACHEAGLRIPDDVAVVGVNDEEFVCSVCDPPLSSIPLQTHRIGYEAAALLQHLLQKAPLPPWSIVIPPGELIVRQSSDTLATTDKLVIDAVKYIREHLHLGVGTKEVAAEMGISRTTLDMRLSAAIGRTAAMEIRRERMNLVCQLLSSTDLPMPEVARRSGFSSARQLSESFRLFLHQTPTDYRNYFRVRSGR